MTLADVRTEHPLAMTTAEEVERVRAALAEAGLLGDTVRFAFFLPEEPPKAEVLGFSDGDASTGASAWPCSTSPPGAPGTRSSPRRTARSSRRASSTRPPTGQPPIIDSEFEVVEEILNADAGWLAALEKRGIDPTSVRGGAAVGRASTTTRTRRAGGSCARSAFVAGRTRRTTAWAHPIDGLVAYVDLIDAHGRPGHRRTAPLPVPAERGNFDDPELHAARRAPP